VNMINIKLPFVKLPNGAVTAKKFASFLIFVLVFGFSALGLAQTAELRSAALRDSVNQIVESQSKMKYISQTVISQDGKSVAWAADGPQGNSTHAVYYTFLSNPGQIARVSAVAVGTYSYEAEPQWSPDGSEIAFISDGGHDGQNQIYVAAANGKSFSLGKALTKLDGYISHLSWSPNGKYLSVLYVEKASREPSPMAAENKRLGLVDSLVNHDVQRLAIIDRLSSKLQILTPASLYVFEYNWAADSRKLAFTGASPPGDDNWYIAQLYQQNLQDKAPEMLYKPTRQIAVPRWSPDGSRIAFIEGLMSDQGGTGGEIFMLSVHEKRKFINLTPNRQSTPGWFCWLDSDKLIFTEYVGGSLAVQRLNVTSGKLDQLWYAKEHVQATSEQLSLSVSGRGKSPVFAFIRDSWSALPEVWAGDFRKLRQVTQLNAGIKLKLPKAQDLHWQNEQQHVQGWLLYPDNYDPARKYPMLVSVHGGPAWITMPTTYASDFNTTIFTHFGYFVFFPNPRGSYGQGEHFTQANRQDWGFGDLSDILTGIDRLKGSVSIDTNRIGILGWSYGGFMSMFAGTQTQRFRAAVAGAGAADWLSYYGQNSIDKWMKGYFDRSPYEDPAPYVRSSAMTYITKTKTPTLILVGEGDGEAPSIQSVQFWHALKELKIPTQLMIYPGEGHSFEKPAHLLDVTVRTLSWFEHHMPAF
jgi:dipeptidyl aminopeptidase/acylaminoacyl peptidase